MRYTPSYLQARRVLQDDEKTLDIAKGFAVAMGISNESVLDAIAAVWTKTAIEQRKAVEKARTSRGQREAS